jgi:predicted nucleotidyltransferase
MNRKNLAIEFASSLNYPEIEKIILYGSVARNEDKKDSDIDILIITSNIDDDLKIRDNIYSKTFDTLLKTGENLSVHFVDKEHYDTHLNFPFYMSLEKEGILIG